MFMISIPFTKCLRALFKAGVVTLLLSVLGACMGESTNDAASLASLDDAALTSQASASVVAEAAYFRLPVPGRDVSSAYLTLRNTSEQALGLTEFSSEQVRAIELHEHVHKDGVMQMRRVEQFVLPAGDTLVMQPGGYHLMLFGLSESLAEGDKITIELMLTTGDNVSIPLSGRAVR